MICLVWNNLVEGFLLVVVNVVVDGCERTLEEPDI